MLKESEKSAFQEKINAIANPHDRYFFASMNAPICMESFLKSYLPNKLQAITHWDTLKLENAKYVSKELEKKESDVLYSATIGEDKGYFYLLVEHQSTPDDLMSLRLLEYRTCIMRQHLKQNKGDKTLPIVYPMVYYSGSGRYNSTNDLFKLFGSHEDLARELFFAPFQLINLKNLSDEEIQCHGWVSIMEFFLKHARQGFTSKATECLINIVNIFGADGQFQEFLELSFNYMCEAGKKSKINADVLELISDKETERKVMTFKEHWKLEGLEEGRQLGHQIGHQIGRQEGRQEGRRETERCMAEALIRKGVDAALIKSITHLTDAEIDLIAEGVS